MANVDDKARVRTIIRKLDKLYPGATTELRFTSPLELLVATILAAQCTDERVNIVTESLFKKYPSASAYAEVAPEVLEADVKSTGFFRQKTKAIIGCCRGLVEDHGGDVPASLDALVALPGIGRKSANLILGHAYGMPGVIVDTHVKRIATRLGLTKKKDPDKIEVDLCAVTPKKQWTHLSDVLIQHGRHTCVAGKPYCSRCEIRELCMYDGEGR